MLTKVPNKWIRSSSKFEPNSSRHVPFCSTQFPVFYRFRAVRSRRISHSNQVSKRIPVLLFLAGRHIWVFAICDAIELDKQAMLEALPHFKSATDDLNMLIQHVCSFVDWWGNMNTRLANLEGVLPQITLDGKCPLRTQTAKGRWEEVHYQYMSYQRQVCWCV